jgi:hypothetical protein
VHRVVTIKLAKAGPLLHYPLDSSGFPFVVGGDGEVFAFEVHHMDWDKGNNEAGNLLLLDERLHDGCNAGGRVRDERGRWISRALAVQRAEAAREHEFAEATRGAPDWVTRDEEVELDGLD